jgi:ATP-dependent Clp protease protease subunit
MAERGQDWPVVPRGIPGLPGVPSVPFPGELFEPGSGPEPLSDTLAQRLLAQRVVLLHGPLDDVSVTRASAELMTLDAEGDDPVSLRVDCPDGSLASALTLMDVIELMGVPVRAMCLGRVGGGALGVVAVCAHRSAMPSTQFTLREPASGSPAPLHARNVEQWAQLRADERDRFCARLAAATGHPVAEVRDDLVGGRYLAADEAVAYGLIDEVSRPEPGADVRRLPPRPGDASGGPPGSPGGAPAPGGSSVPMGFRPPH